jgi:hypothetical protein
VLRKNENGEKGDDHLVYTCNRKKAFANLSF